MSFERLSRVDLNLLVTMHFLLEHHSVSKAAEHLNLSQSAVSKSLSRLRTLFDDPLFEREGYGVTPTPRALQLQPLLNKLLMDIELMTAPDTFDPQQSQRVFQIAAVESIYSILFPHFIDEAVSKAPRITFETINWHRDSFEQLQKGMLDFAITGQDLHTDEMADNSHLPDGIQSSILYQDRLCCLVNSKHPALTREWNTDAYLFYRHIVTRFYKKERWFLDSQLAKNKLRRDAAIYVPDFNSAAELCSHTDFILTAPGLYANHIASQLNLAILPLPLTLPPLAYKIFWHENRKNDPAHHWLKELILSRSKTLK